MAQTIVVLKPAHFFSIDNDIIDVHAKTIGALGIAIYAVLARYANRRTGACWPAIARIQRTLHLGRSTVKRYLHRLEVAGLITVEERRDEAGDRSSNRYTLLDPTPEAVAQRTEDPEELAACMAVTVEGGGSTANLPPAPSEPTGGVAVDPEPVPDPQNQKKLTIQESAPLEKTLRQQTCPHPDADVHRLADGITICHHCFGLLDDGVQCETPSAQESWAA